MDKILGYQLMPVSLASRSLVQNTNLHFKIMIVDIDIAREVRKEK